MKQLIKSIIEQLENSRDAKKENLSWTKQGKKELCKALETEKQAGAFENINNEIDALNEEIKELNEEIAKISTIIEQVKK